MRLRSQKGAWILGVLFLIGIVFPAFSPARATAGISVTVYDNFGYNDAPPLPDVSGRPVVGTTTFSQINQNFDAEPPFNMYEDYIVKYEGYITSPVTGNILFWPWADDGTLFYLDGTLIDPGNWVDKGGGGYQTGPQPFVAGVSRPFVYWFYENGGGAWTQLYWDIGNGWEIVPASAFSQIPAATTTTTIPRSLGKPTNIVLTDTGSGIKIDWDAAQDNVNISPERYAISWSTGGSGWGIATGNVGDQNALNTEVTLSYAMFSSTGGLDAEYNITVRADNDTQGVYSQQSNPAVLKIGTNPTPPTTTSTTTTTTTSTTTTPATTTTSEPKYSTTVPEQTTTSITVENTTTSIPISTTTTTTTIAPAPQTTTTLEITTTSSLPPTTTTTTTTIVPETKEQMSQEEAVSAATNGETLKEVSKEEAVKIFDSIDTSEITEEQKSEIIEAVQNAPEEVKEAFEEEINIYADGFDDYVPVGSVIDVGTRRSLIAATTVLSTVTVGAAASGGSSGPSSRGPSSSGGGGSSGPDPNSAAKKENEEEEEEEEAAEIEGPEGDEEENTFTRNSIYKYQEGTMKRTFNPWGFVKKFAKETAALAFTISGTVIVFATLSGDTRKITLIATSCAFAVHYLNAMLQNDE